MDLKRVSDESKVMHLLYAASTHEYFKFGNRFAVVSQNRKPKIGDFQNSEEEKRCEATTLITVIIGYEQLLIFYNFKSEKNEIYYKQLAKVIT